MRRQGFVDSNCSRVIQCTHSDDDNGHAGSVVIELGDALHITRRVFTSWQWHAMHAYGSVKYAASLSHAGTDPAAFEFLMG